jgi:hypothetical protein
MNRLKTFTIESMHAILHEHGWTTPLKDCPFHDNAHFDAAADRVMIHVQREVEELRKK